MSPVKSPEELSARDAGKKDKIVVEKDEAEELLPGWTKEVKTRKTGSAKKVDRYYTDPVTGYIFRSLKDVQRYLKTGEVGRLAIKPKTDEREKSSETLIHKRAPTDKPEIPARASKRLAGGSSDVPSPSPPELKTCQATRLAGIKVDSPSPPEPETRKATRLAGVAVDAPPLPSTSPPEPKTHQATRLAGVTVDAPPQSTSPSPPKPKTRKATHLAGVAVDAPPQSPPEPKTRHATLLTGREIGPSPPSQPEPKTRQAKWLLASPQPKTRQATRQAGIKIDSPPPSPPDTRTSRQATRPKPVNSTTSKENNKKTKAEKPTNNRNENADVDANTNHNQENSIITPPSNQESNKKQIEPGPTTSPPPIVPPVNLQKQESPVVNPTITNPVPQSDTSINFSMTDLWTDPCIEFAIKTLTGAIPFTDLNKVENFTTASSQVPLEELWTDPCIEFAVKTLTGAIPVTEDDYLLHRPVSSANPPVPHNFSSPMNVCQTGHKKKQQDSVFPTLGNGGLQKSGKFVNGSKGQCSRSRFFQ